MLELAIADAAEHAERMLKTFRSGCAVAEDLLQLMIDKLDVVRQHAAATLNQVPQQPPLAGGAADTSGAAANSVSTAGAAAGDASAGSDGGAGASLPADQPT